MFWKASEEKVPSKLPQEMRVVNAAWPPRDRGT
jgi:hypothetical protein